MPAAVRAALPLGTLEKLSLVVVTNVAPIPSDVFPIVSNIAAVSPQVSIVFADVAPFGSCGSVISILHVVAQLATVLSDVAGIVLNITPILVAVNSIVSKVSPVAAQVAILAQRKRRSQHSKHQPSYDSSSHIASLVSGPLGLCDLEHSDIEKVLRRVSIWKGGSMSRVEPESAIEHSACLPPLRGLLDPENSIRLSNENQQDIKHAENRHELEKLLSDHTSWMCDG